MRFGVLQHVLAVPVIACLARPVTAAQPAASPTG
jgi:hypothetical protein